MHQYYRAFTAMWLHASFTHIFFNMIALLIVGPAVEVLLGKARFLVLYLLAGLGGSVGSYILSQPNVAGIGASGAIMGVLGRLRRGRPAPPPARGAGGRAAGAQLRHRVHRQHRLAGPPRRTGDRVRPGLRSTTTPASLRDRTTALVLTVGGSVAVLALLALLITSIAPGHFNLS